MPRLSPDRLFWSLALAVLPLGLAGCGGGPARMKLYPVNGQVLLNDKALADHRVVFLPVDKVKYEREHPFAITDKEGKFRLSTYEQGDGAPAGEFVVVFFPNDELDDGSDQRKRTSPLPTRYMSADKSDFRVKIEGETSLPPFKLQK
jgi:hypothetical protein